MNKEELETTIRECIDLIDDYFNKTTNLPVHIIMVLGKLTEALKQ